MGIFMFFSPFNSHLNLMKTDNLDDVSALPGTAPCRCVAMQRRHVTRNERSSSELRELAWFASWMNSLDDHGKNHAFFIGVEKGFEKVNGE